MSRPRRLRAATVAVVLLGALALGDGRALARSSQLLSYPFEEIWPTAVRYLRIDRGATLKERDAESGYLLFELSEAGKSYKGALELVRASDPEGREATRVLVTLSDLPRHYENTLLEKLQAKVKEEHGSPAPPPPRRAPGTEPPRKPAPDGGLPHVR